jgi:uncharacterized protein YeaO (DUF488 family)
MIKIKRIYEDYSKTDGYRILVDRLWPRGISKERAKVDLWVKEITPSNDLRQWYHDNLEKREQFQKKYIAEIEKNFDSLNEIKKIIHDQKIITLLSASKDSKPIHAIVLQRTLKDQS